MMVKKVISLVYVMQIYEPLFGSSMENYLFVIVKIQLATWNPCHWIQFLIVKLCSKLTSSLRTSSQIGLHNKTAASPRVSNSYYIYIFLIVCMLVLVLSVCLNTCSFTGPGLFQRKWRILNSLSHIFSKSYH